MMTFAIGMVSQILFFSRTIVQWGLSEKARKIISPDIYWILSLIASLLFFIYGWLRNDFSILLGQSITYYIYILNLRLNGSWQKLHQVARLILLVLPLFFAVFVAKESHTLFNKFFADHSIPFGLILFGSIGQLVFTFRFVYQIVYSLKKKKSVLPVGFWIISLVGSLMIFVYGLIRKDPILMLGQSLGLLAYIRNIMLHVQSKITV
jgi:lipid-A-disaccharide synthase-like uncharacterized protein